MVLVGAVVRIGQLNILVLESFALDWSVYLFGQLLGHREVR